MISILRVKSNISYLKKNIKMLLQIKKSHREGKLKEPSVGQDQMETAIEDGLGLQQAVVPWKKKKLQIETF